MMMVTIPARNDTVLHGDQCRPLRASRLAARTYPAPRAMSTATVTRLNQSVCHPVMRVWSWTGGEIAPANNIGPSLSGHQPGSQPGWTRHPVDQAGSGAVDGPGRGREVSGGSGGRSRGQRGVTTLIPAALAAGPSSLS